MRQRGWKKMGGQALSLVVLLFLVFIILYPVSYTHLTLPTKA